MRVHNRFLWREMEGGGARLRDHWLGEHVPSYLLPTDSANHQPNTVPAPSTAGKGGSNRGPRNSHWVASSGYEGGKTGFLPKPFPVRSSFPFLSFVTYPPHSLPSCNNIYAPVVGQSTQPPFAFTHCVLVKIPPKYLGSLTKWQPAKSYLQHPDRCPQLLSNDGQRPGHNCGRCFPSLPSPLSSRTPALFVPYLLPLEDNHVATIVHTAMQLGSTKEEGRGPPCRHRCGIMAFLHLQGGSTSNL